MSRIPLSSPDVGLSERAALLDSFDAGFLAAGPSIPAFETAFAAYVGAAHAVGAASGTAALHLALKAVGVGPGDLVIAPTLTFIGGVAPIVHLGAEPLFVDAEAESWGLDPALLGEAFDHARALGRRVGAVIATDLFGQTCDAPAIAAICRGRGVPLVLDSAEAVGALHDGRHAGVEGVCAIFSFNGNKIITTGGGGMLTTDDAALAERVRFLGATARSPALHYEHPEVGFNYRLSALAAALGLAQLGSIDARVARRRAIFQTYVARLSGLPGLGFQSEAPGRRHTRWLSVAMTQATPDRLCHALADRNIEARPVWKPMHLQPAFAGAERVGGDVAEGLFARGLCLPSGSGLTDAQVERVCQAMEEVWAAGS